MKDDAYIENLFRRVAFKDDQQAFKELFFEFYPSLCVYAERFTGCKETGEDLVQDAFMKIWRDRKKIEITSSFRNFLITIVKTLAWIIFANNLYAKIIPKKETFICFPIRKIYTLKELKELISRALDKLPEYQASF